MTRFKDFGNPSTTERIEPLSFKLYGEEFHCVPAIQGKVLLDIAADSGSDDPTKSAGVVLAFFSKALKPESYARLETLMASDDKIVTVETLAEITGWLVEEYADRPEGQPGV